MNCGAIILASGTKEEKLKKLKDKHSSIHIEKFNLNEHDKIEVIYRKAHSNWGVRYFNK